MAEKMELDKNQLDDLWMAAQEVHTFVAGQTGAWMERIIDRAAPHHIFREHIARYNTVLDDTRGKDVLDMACGTGYGSDYVYHRSAPKSIVGVDIDADAVRYARLRYKRNPIEFVQADACTVKLDRKFDTIVSFETIEHVPRPDHLLHRVSEMLKPEGVFHVSSPIRRGGSLADKPANPHHVREWTVDEFGALLGLFFEHVEIKGQMFTLLKRRGPLRIPGRLVRMMAKPVPLSSPFFEALIYDVLPLDIVPAKYQACPPVSMIARCTGLKPNISESDALRLAMG